jgi:hypothetical protein
MAAPPALPPLDGTLGVIQVGLVLATWLFGIETLQTFNYYREFPKDPIGLKGLVCFRVLNISTAIFDDASTGRRHLVKLVFHRSHRFLTLFT